MKLFCFKYQGFLTLIFLFLLILPFSAFPEILLETNVLFFSPGFLNNRETTDTACDKIVLTSTSFQISFPLINSFYMETGYYYSHLLQSQGFLNINYINKKGNIFLEGGFTLGSLNELPIKAVPGIQGEGQIKIFNHLIFNIQGKTSFFLHPLVSLTTLNYSFDQNFLALTMKFDFENAGAGFRYLNENIYIKDSQTTSTRNSVKTFETIIYTLLDDFWINSTTAIGTDIHDFKKNSSHHRLLLFYLNETLYFSLHRIELMAGTKLYFLSFMLEDVKSVSPPGMPYFNLHGGIRFTL